MNNQYDDIIHLPHHVSSTRPQMPLKDRAAQFAPFAALTGYDTAVKETARLTDARLELDDMQKEELNDRLQQLVNRTDNCSEASFTYFVPDKKKAGGKYATAIGCLKKIDEIERMVILTNGIRIPIDELYDIEVQRSKLSE